MNLKKLFPALLSSSTTEYTYDLEQQVVKGQLDSLFHKSGSFFSDPDFNGNFNSDKDFQLYVNSGAYTHNGYYGSMLFGTLRSLENKTLIEVTIKASAAFKGISVLAFMGGLLAFYFCITNFSLINCTLAIGLLFFSPFVCNKFAEVANGVVEERYYMYIDKTLRKLTTTYISSNATNLNP